MHPILIQTRKAERFNHASNRTARLKDAEYCRSSKQTSLNRFVETRTKFSLAAQEPRDRSACHKAERLTPSATGKRAFWSLAKAASRNFCSPNFPLMHNPGFGLRPAWLGQSSCLMVRHKLSLSVLLSRPPLVFLVTRFCYYNNQKLRLPFFSVIGLIEDRWLISEHSLNSHLRSLVHRLSIAIILICAPLNSLRRFSFPDLVDRRPIMFIKPSSLDIELIYFSFRLSFGLLSSVVFFSRFLNKLQSSGF